MNFLKSHFVFGMFIHEKMLSSLLNKRDGANGGQMKHGMENKDMEMAGKGTGD